MTATLNNGASTMAFSSRLRMLSHNVRRMKNERLYSFERVIEEQSAAHCTIDGRRLVVLGSYSYLGLGQHPEVIAAARQAFDDHGAGAHGTRITLGTMTPHRQLEQTLADWIGTDDAMVVSSGLSANISVLQALATAGDTIFFDTVNHASLHDGCRLSNARLVEFNHLDLVDLRAKLAAPGDGLRYVVIDAVFSMDGDIVNLPVIRDLCDKAGAILVVDEAHSIGVLGKAGAGITSHFDMSPDAIDVRIGVLSKAIPGVGGFVAGSAALIEALKATNHAFIFSGALPASVVAGADAAIQILQRDHRQLLSRLEHNRDFWVSRLRQAGFHIGLAGETPIVPVFCPSSQIALEMVQRCFKDEVLMVAAIYPAVAIDKARLRTTVTAAHSESDLEFAVNVLTHHARQLGLISQR